MMDMSGFPTNGLPPLGMEAFEPNMDAREPNMGAMMSVPGIPTPEEFAMSEADRMQQETAMLSSIPLPTFLEPSSPIKVAKKDRAAIAAMVVDKFRYAEMNMGDIRTIWEGVRDAYHSEKDYTVPKGVKKPESRVKSNLLRSLINRMVAMLTVRIVQPYDNFIFARERKTKKRIHKIENYLFDMFKKNQMAVEIVNAVMRAGLYGVGFTKVFPNYYSGEPDCVVEAVNNFDIFIDPAARSLKDAAFIIHRIWLDYDTVVSRMESGVYDKKEGQKLLNYVHLRSADGVEGLLSSDNIVRSGGTSASNEFVGTDGYIKASSVSSDDVYRSDLRSLSDSSTKKFDRILIYEFHDGGNIYTIGEELFLLRAAKSVIGYPFQAWFLMPSTGDEFWVKSHGEYLVDLQREMDVKRNQRIENINKIVNPPMMHLKNLVSDNKILVMDSGSRIPVNDIEAFKFVEIPDVTNTLVQESQLLRSEGEDTTNVTPMTQGVAAKKERMTTAESQSLQGAANLPFDFSSSLLVTTGMIPMFRCILNMCAFIFKGMIAEASSSPNGIENVEEIMPEEFMMDLDMDVAINPNKEQMDKSDAMQLYQLFSNHPFVDQMVLLQWILPRLSPDYPRELVNPQTMMQPMPQNVQLSNNKGPAK